MATQQAAIQHQRVLLLELLRHEPGSFSSDLLQQKSPAFAAVIQLSPETCRVCYRCVCSLSQDPGLTSSTSGNTAPSLVQLLLPFHPPVGAIVPSTAVVV